MAYWTDISAMENKNFYSHSSSIYPICNRTVRSCASSFASESKNGLLFPNIVQLNLDDTYYQNGVLSSSSSSIVASSTGTVTLDFNDGTPKTLILKKDVQILLMFIIGVFHTLN